MDTKSGYPWWTVSNGLIGQFPSLRTDTQCEVAVIGAGITGSLVAHALAEAGMDVLVIDRREAGWGSTAASTALLQYEIDTPLVDLIKRYGETAARAYQACDEAIDTLAGIVAGMGEPVGFRPCGSLYFASKRRHVAALKREYQARQRHGLPVEQLDAAGVRERFGIDAPLALWTPHAARLDPYRFARVMLDQLGRRGVRVHDASEVQEWTAESQGLRLRMSNGAQVRCAHLVVAAGYETQRWLKQRVAVNHSSYALITEPLDALPLQLHDNVIWESARPYVYLRGTDDRRIIIGGEDDRLDLPAKRAAALPRKVGKLMDRLRALAPDIQPELAFSWAGTFAETDDGLPFVGNAPGHDPRVHFVMAYGGNGITYSTIAAAMVRDAIQGKRHPLDALFGFGRLAG
ncbi:MAG: NAD(P)/FAD-dependent oxidoreductase [Dyella sp.]|uniref:NAD(P)/FAD-dependent oxidoreductase n=1 Tax=Dyella sp. TaxID=1869338 RepID=UPI003F81E48B